MDQSITINIAGTDYPLKASSPEAEKLYRLAAEDIKRLLGKYDERFPGKPLVDKLAFVALQEAVGKYTSQTKLNALVDELQNLTSETGAYLAGTDKK